MWNSYDLRSGWIEHFIKPNMYLVLYCDWYFHVLVLSCFCCRSGKIYALLHHRLCLTTFVKYEPSLTSEGSDASTYRSAVDVANLFYTTKEPISNLPHRPPIWLSPKVMPKVVEKIGHLRPPACICLVALYFGLRNYVFQHNQPRGLYRC